MLDQKSKIKDQNGNAGFTLVEILVVVAILVIIGVAITGLGADLFKQNYRLSKQLVADTEAKIALTRLITELRRAQPASTGAYAIESASSTGLIFYSDTNNDGIRERLRYFIAGSLFKRGLIIPTGQPYVYNLSNESLSTVINNLGTSSPTIFTYYDSSYDGTASSSALTEPVEIKNIRLIKVDLLHLTSQVMLRNLKDNL